MKYFMKKNSTAMKDARILGVDVVESVSMIMAGILYETGLIRKIKIILCTDRLIVITTLKSCWKMISLGLMWQGGCKHGMTLQLTKLKFGGHR